MKENTLRLTEMIEKKKWSEFVYNHPHGTIFQTPDMEEVYRRTKNHEPISLAVIDEDTGEIFALLLAVVLKEMGGFLGSFSARSIIHGGPLFVEGERGELALKNLMEYYNKLAGKKALYSEIRNIDDTSNFKPLFEDSGYNFEEHFNFLIDLKKTEEEVLKQIHRSMRKNIKKAQNKGVTIEEIKDKSYIRTYYEFLKDVYGYARVPLADITLFEAIFDVLVPEGMAKFHFAKHDGGYIGARSTFIYKKLIYAHHVAVPRAYRNLYPNALLNYHIIAWGQDNGYHTFDFGGAGNPKKEYGVREFKKQFGGDLVNFGRYKKLHHPLKIQIAEKGFEVYKKLKHV